MAYALPSDVDERPIAIDGAGTLGRRIAAVYAAAGTDVHLFDVSAEQRDAAKAYVSQHLDETRRLLGLDDMRTGRVEVFDDLAAALRGAWMVIEAVPELLDVKQQVFAQLDELARRRRDPGEHLVVATHESAPRRREASRAGAEHALPAAAGV